MGDLSLMEKRLSQLLLSASAIAVAVTGISFSSISTAEAQIDELIVSARKRDENIQNVPLTVNAFTGDQLKNQVISSVEGLTSLVAGFEMDRSFNRSFDRPVIRGKSTIFAGSDPSSFFIDGAFYEGSITNIDVSNMERVEVIKGPQSALFGRSTYSGAINFISKLPGDEFEGSATVTVGTNDHYDVSGRLSGPIVEGKLSGSVFLRHYEYGGDWTSEVDGQDLGEEETNNVQATLNFTPSESGSAVLNLYYNNQDDGQFAAGFQPHEFNNIAERDTGGRDYFEGELRELPFQNNTTFAALLGDVGEEQDHFGAHLNVSWDLSDAVTLTSITSYDKFETKINTGGYEGNAGILSSCTGAAPANLNDLTCTPIFGVASLIVNDVQDSSLFSQDIRFDIDNGGPWRALVGGYYYKEDNDSFVNPIDFSGFVPSAAQASAIEEAFANALQFEAAQDCFDDFDGCNPNVGTATVVGADAATLLAAHAIQPVVDINDDVENIALYGRFEWDVTEAITLGIEGRYAEDELSETNVTSDVSETEKFSSFSPRFTADWQLTDDNKLYFVYARGNKPGGFNLGRVALAVQAEGRDVTSFDEEQIDSFEIGTKNSFFDGQFLFNAAYYYEEVQDYQLTDAIFSTTLSESGTVIANKGEVEFQGVEIEADFAPQAVEGLNLRLNYAWNDNEFTEGVDPTQGQINDVLDDGMRNCSLGVSAETGSCFVGISHTPAQGSIVGNRTPLSSEHQVSASIDYAGPLGNADWNWFAGANVSYESEKYVQVLNLAEIPASTVVDLNLGVNNDNFRVTAWGKNVFDEDAVVSGTRFFSAEDFFRRAFTFFPRRGPEWGVSLNANF